MHPHQLRHTLATQHCAGSEAADWSPHEVAPSWARRLGVTRRSGDLVLTGNPVVVETFEHWGCPDAGVVFAVGGERGFLEGMVIAGDVLDLVSLIVAPVAEVLVGVAEGISRDASEEG